MLCTETPPTKNLGDIFGNISTDSISSTRISGSLIWMCNRYRPEILSATNLNLASLQLENGDAALRSRDEDRAQGHEIQTGACHGWDTLHLNACKGLKAIELPLSDSAGCHLRRATHVVRSHRAGSWLDASCDTQWILIIWFKQYLSPAFWAGISKCSTLRAKPWNNSLL